MKIDYYWAENALKIIWPLKFNLTLLVPSFFNLIRYLTELPALSICKFIL